MKRVESWHVAAAIFAAVILLALLLWLGLGVHLTPAEWAAWLQAAGSLLALGAVGLQTYASQRSSREQQAQDHAEARHHNRELELAAQSAMVEALRELSAQMKSKLGRAAVHSQREDWTHSKHRSFERDMTGLSNLIERIDISQLPTRECRKQFMRLRNLTNTTFQRLEDVGDQLGGGPSRPNLFANACISSVNVHEQITAEFVISENALLLHRESAPGLQNFAEADRKGD